MEGFGRDCLASWAMEEDKEIRWTERCVRVGAVELEFEGFASENGGGDIGGAPGTVR